MSSTVPKTSLSSTSGTSTPTRPSKLSDYQNAGLDHAPHLTPLRAAKRTPSTVQPLSIKVNDAADGAVPGFLHLPSSRASSGPASKTAAILLSGAGGGVVGPSSMYLSIADKLASLSNGIPVLRLDFRYPARNKYCVRDTLAAMDWLESEHDASRFVLVGWSFGGAPVFTVGGSDQRVVGCATVASQTAETEGIRSLAPRPVLLLHGTGDSTLSPACSERLYAMYGSKGDRKLKLFDGDNHALSRNALRAEEMLCEFIMGCAGVTIREDEQKGVVQSELVGDGERMEKMRRGGDLRGRESME
ncbi:hypothetical protein W97_04370 [Coniosporium apollinis CBS 100218]|uniref:Uncharacterized protein n=1 Tax=Coniosporium apollinis (strain CBS 100218) TaxID=1168221 RepID=R7YTH3_CONA1|nr:uncharacterized protein W97_04370 [Coniosporium apollinis CBS 100218]EON65133.1 hypothetical protein W97_04370 [Coniosporium apollinis CBS 100218]